MFQLLQPGRFFAQGMAGDECRMDDIHRFGSVENQGILTRTSRCLKRDVPILVEFAHIFFF